MRAVFAIILALCFVVTPVLAADVDTIDKDQLKQMLGSDDLVLLDVRTGGDWSSSEFKIKGAMRADPSEIASWSKNYEKDKTFVLYCS